MSHLPEFLCRTALLSFVVLTVGCSESPSDVLAAIEAAARNGDASTFASHFTAESRPFAEALVTIQKYVRKDEPSRAPIQNIFHARVISERISGPRAVVTIAGPAGKSAIVFVREAGNWKLDVAASELESAAGAVEAE